jgi:hypothetical protein
LSRPCGVERAVPKRLVFGAFIVAPAGAPGYAAMTAAYSRALSKLADSIAPALNALPVIKH